MRQMNLRRLLSCLRRNGYPLFNLQSYPLIHTHCSSILLPLLRSIKCLSCAAALLRLVLLLRVRRFGYSFARSGVGALLTFLDGGL